MTEAKLPPDGPKRYVYCKPPKCPECGSLHILAYRKNPAEPDGTVSRYTRCADCNARFVVVEEPDDDV